MSKILNRPMFRGGGKVSSYGNGIASGLADGGMASKRGLVDGPGGYSGEFTRFRDYSLSNPGSPVYTGGSIKAGLSGSSTPFAKVRDNVGLAGTNIFNKYIGNTLENIPNRFGNFFYGEDNAIEPNIDMTMDQYRDSLPSQTTSGFDFVDNLLGFGKKDSPKRYKSDDPRLMKEATRLSQLLIPQKSEDDYYIEDDISVSEDERMKDTSDRNKESRTLTNQMYEDLGLEGKGGSGTGTGEKLTDKERVEKSKKLYKELLSGDKSARIADLSDWALSLFEKSTKEGATVKSMLGEVAGEISKKPSRSENLDRDASKLAIQDLMMERKSKSDAAAFKDKTMFQLENAAAIKGRKGSFEEILEVTSKGGKRKNNSNIAAAIGLKYGSGAWTGILKAGESPPTDGIFIQENENGSKLVIRVVEGAIDVLHTVV
jgi:hypothetical protein